MNFKFLIILNFFTFSAHSGKSTYKRLMQSTCYQVWLRGGDLHDSCCCSGCGGGFLNKKHQCQCVRSSLSNVRLKGQILTPVGLLDPNRQSQTWKEELEMWVEMDRDRDSQFAVK